MQRRPKSDIPQAADEVRVREGAIRDQVISPAQVECRWGGELVGYRFYLQDGTLVQETPLKDGKKHGREYFWWNGKLKSVEPYRDGKLHGTAKQYSPQSGRVIGRYKFIQGTGFDLWRSWCGDRQDGSYPIAEIHSHQNGFHQGYDWWLNPDQQSVYEESHWYADQRHGIERHWNQAGRLRRGYPKYWIHGEQVAKRQYLKAAQKDSTLPHFCKEDDLPQRSFPLEIQNLLRTTLMNSNVGTESAYKT